MMMTTIRRTLGMLLAVIALVLGFTAATAHAAPKSALAAADCTAINLNANVSNLGVGYVFNGKCNARHWLVIRTQWVGVFGEVLSDQIGWLNPRDPGIWHVYSGNMQRPWNGPSQTSHACIWITQDNDTFHGGPLLTSGCFLRNS